MNVTHTVIPPIWRLVILESPFAGIGKNRAEQWYDAWQNRIYLNKAIRHSINRGDSPYASHKMLTTALNDSNPEERTLGIYAGLAWAGKAAAVCVYIDRGVSRGMLMELDLAEREDRVVEYYSIRETSKLLISRGALEGSLRQ